MKPTISFLFTAAFVSFALCAKAQTVLLEEDVNKDTLSPASGPNMKNYTHSYFRYGFVLGKSTPGAEIKTGNSNEVSFGVRYKRRLANFYALGADFFYNNINYHLKQDSAKIFPTPALHKKEKLAYNNFGLELYNRINFGKRGNIIGNYFDFGGYGEWGFIIKHFYRDELAVAQAGASVREVTNRRLLYTNELNYGAVARIGFNRYSVYGKYRLSDIVKESYLNETGFFYPELPRFIVGVEIGLLK